MASIIPTGYGVGRWEFKSGRRSEEDSLWRVVRCSERRECRSQKTGEERLAALKVGGLPPVCGAATHAETFWPTRVGYGNWSTSDWQMLASPALIFPNRLRNLVQLLFWDFQIFLPWTGWRTTEQTLK